VKRFRVKYLDAAGRYRQVDLQADNARGCELRVRQEGNTFIACAEVAAAAGSAGRQRYTAEDLVEFTTVTAALLSAAVTIRDALGMVATVANRPAVRALALRLASGIDKGEAFASAAAREGRCFPPLSLALIGIGERTGDLARSFERIASWAERRHKLQTALANALTYPILVMSVMVIGGLAAGIYALPRLNELFTSMGGTAAAQLRLSMEQARGNFLGLLVFLVGLTVAIVVAAALRRRSEPARRLIDGLWLRLPLLGRFLSDFNTLDFVFAMEALVSSGITVNEAMLEASDSISNAAYRAAVLAARLNINKGLPLSAAFATQTVLPGQLNLWLSVGERSGNVAAVFSRMRLYYEDSVSKWITRFLALIEPGMSLVVGLIILFLIFTFIIPFFNAYGSML